MSATPDPVDEFDGFDDAYTDALRRVGKLNTELSRAVFSQDQAARTRLEAERDAAMVERDALKEKIAKHWLRGLRFAIDSYGLAIRQHLDGVLDGSDLEQRVDAAENAIVNLESGVTA